MQLSLYSWLRLGQFSIAAGMYFTMCVAQQHALDSQTGNCRQICISSIQDAEHKLHGFVAWCSLLGMHLGAFLCGLSLYGLPWCYM